MLYNQLFSTLIAVELQTLERWLLDPNLEVKY